MIKGCSNCEFNSRSVQDEPCCSCFGCNKWIAGAELKTYEQGLNEAWEAAREISSFNADTQREIYGCHGLYFIVHDYTAQSAIAKLKDYKEAEEKKFQFQVGDEVLSGAGYYGIVTRTEENHIYVLFRDGSCGKKEKQYWKKTGKHFEDIKNFLAN